MRSKLGRRPVPGWANTLWAAPMTHDPVTVGAGDADAAAAAIPIGTGSARRVEREVRGDVQSECDGDQPREAVGCDHPDGVRPVV